VEAHLLPVWLRPRFLSSALRVTTVSAFQLRWVLRRTTEPSDLLCSRGEMVALAAAAEAVTPAALRGVEGGVWVCSCAWARRAPAESRRRSMVRRRERMVARGMDQAELVVFCC
jgi:hypothetical protein